VLAKARGSFRVASGGGRGLWIYGTSITVYVPAECGDRERRRRGVGRAGSAAEAENREPGIGRIGAASGNRVSRLHEPSGEALAASSPGRFRAIPACFASASPHPPTSRPAAQTNAGIAPRLSLPLPRLRARPAPTLPSPSSSPLRRQEPGGGSRRAAVGPAGRFVRSPHLSARPTTPAGAVVLGGAMGDARGTAGGAPPRPRPPCCQVREGRHQPLARKITVKSRPHPAGCARGGISPELAQPS